MVGTMNFAAALRKDMYERMDTEDMIAAAVSKDGMLLSKVKNKTPRIIYNALKQNWRALQFVDTIDNFLARQVILMNPEAASLLPSEHHLMAVIADINAFDYMVNPSMDACYYVLEANPDWISKIANPPLELCVYAIKERHTRALDYVSGFLPRPHNVVGYGYLKDMPVSDKLLQCALDVTDGYAYLSFSAEDKERYAEVALGLNHHLIKFMPQTPLRQEMVLRKDPWALRDMVQTPALCRAACEADPTVLQIVKEPTRDMVWVCAAKWKHALKYAVEQDDELCSHAVRHFLDAMVYVKANHLKVLMASGAPMILHITDLERIFPEYKDLMYVYGMSHLFRRIIFSAVANKDAALPTDLEDPVTLVPVEAGTIAAFTHDNSGLHFAGTLDTLVTMIKTGFRGSNTQSIFVPIKNDLVRTSSLWWAVV
jgi:hypothetical protein